MVAQHIEDVTQQNQGAGSQSVQILSVRHLQGFPQEASATQQYIHTYINLYRVDVLVGLQLTIYDLTYLASL